MIVYRQWKSKRGLLPGNGLFYECEGWFFLGFIPLYIRRVGMFR